MTRPVFVCAGITMTSFDQDLKYLKSVVEGDVLAMPFWEWFETASERLESFLSRGQFLRLKANPLIEAAVILQAQGIEVHKSDRYEWLNQSSTSGLCRRCGTKITTHGGTGGGAQFCETPRCHRLFWDNKRTARRP